MSSLRLWLGGFLPILSWSTCLDHSSLSECLAFRSQDRCLWDVASKTCVSGTRCENRRSLRECESELTTGARWDDTQNQCFWDVRFNQCRWSDECFGLDSQQECLQAHCSWRKSCTPQDMSLKPGPNICSEICAIPGDGAPAPPVLGPAPVLSVSHQRSWRRKRSGSSPVVETSTGPVQGNQLEGVSEFLGIPFAQAPVDQLRWAPAEKMQSWNQIFQATEFSAACTQQSAYYAGKKTACQGLTRGKCLGYSEDCLTLNIWTPNFKGPKKAVLLWIHGGCYVSGSASDAEYNATKLAADQDVVVVSVQYRLGVFGFLGSPQIRQRDPKGSTGNYGLMDNIAALQWVQESIAEFGGDPTRVTIFGESSGAGSVSLLMGVKESWPYYQKAIMESGTGSFWSYITLEAAHSNWQEVLQATKCNSTLEDSVISCILSASSTVLTNAVQQIPCRDGCTWAPVLDGVFLRGTPVQQAKAGMLRPNTPSISGFNKNDGAMFVTGYPMSMVTMSQSSLDSYFSERFGEEQKIKLQELFPPVSSSWWISKYFEAAQACETDFSYSCTAQWISSWSSGTSFVYKFSQPNSQGLTLHGDEIPYIFGTLDSPSGPDIQVSQWMMQYWSNFAKTGDPNGGDLPQWPPWQAAPASLLNISNQPVLAEAPNDTWPGCSFFLSNWDFYSLCLPANGRAANISSQHQLIV